jgi:trehalose 6-phosphate synthase/phosphatase
VVLVTSLRDGMNLVSYEYVACQNSKKTEGVLVLSEVSNCGFWNLNMSSMGTCLI